MYNRLTLAGYDWYVLGFSNTWVWRCPTPLLLRRYDEHVSAAHLEVGVGTGYFLDRCRFPVANPTIVVLDLNPNPLRVAAKRIQRYHPQTLQANVLEPIPWDGPRFDSIAVNYVLHCLPGTIAEKAAVFVHLGTLLKDGCPLFGSTILHDGVHQTRRSRRIMALYNNLGAFCNTGDDLDGLDRALAGHFRRYELTTSGSVALFTAWK